MRGTRFLWPSSWKPPSIAWCTSVVILAAVYLFLATVTVLDGGTGQTVRRLLLAVNSSAPINKTADTHATVGDFIESVNSDYVLVTARAPATKAGTAAAMMLPANANVSALAFPSAETQLPLCKAKGNDICGNDLYSIWPVPACCTFASGTATSDTHGCRTLELPYNPSEFTCAAGQVESCCQTAICQASTNQTDCPVTSPDMVCCKDGQCCDPLGSACPFDDNCSSNPPTLCKDGATLGCCPAGTIDLWYWAGETDDASFKSSLLTAGPTNMPDVATTGAPTPGSSSLLYNPATPNMPPPAAYMPSGCARDTFRSPPPPPQTPAPPSGGGGGSHSSGAGGEGSGGGGRGEGTPYTGGNGVGCGGLGEGVYTGQDASGNSCGR